MKTENMRKKYIENRLLELDLKEDKDSVDIAEEIRLQGELNEIEQSELVAEELNPEDIQKELDRMIRYGDWGE